jgi:hypothetical protein
MVVFQKLKDNITNVEQALATIAEATTDEPKY